MALSIATVNKGIDTANKVIGGVKQVGDMLGIGRGREDKRQIEQQQKLTNMGIKGSKEMMDYQQKKEMEMWESTNWEAQKKQAEKAGLSPAWLMSKGGGGTASLGGGGMGVNAGTAADAASTENAKTNKEQLGIQQMMMAAQLENIRASTEKTKAETAKTAGIDTGKATEETRGIKFNNDLNDTLKETEIGRRIAQSASEIIKAEESNALWETKKAINWEDGDYKDVNSRIGKQLIAEAEQVSTNLENAKKEGNIKDAELILRRFEAELTREGIAPNSPFYVKIIGDLLGKIGLNPIKAVGGGK